MRRIFTVTMIVWLEMLRRKDIYVLMIMLASLLLALVSMNIFGLGSISGFVKDAGLLAAWVFGWILAVTCASRQLPQEESRGTILPLLAKPIHRWELLVGKWLGVWLVVATAITSFYLLTALILWGYGGAFNLPTLLQALVLHLAAVGIIISIALALSTRLNADASATITYISTGTMFLIVPRIPELIMQATTWHKTALFVLYIILPHFELFDMRQRAIHQYGTMPWGWWLLVIGYGLILVSFMLCLAWLAFRNKRFSRSNQD
jgi:ABC-type transport system involved in multi-copper enzyme maturation permease subunit